MKILVTGASGLIGKNFIREALREGHEVRALVRNPESFKMLPAEQVFKWTHNSEVRSEALAGVDAIVNLAGENMDRFLWISLGAVLGANLRYWISDWAAQHWGSSFPLGTFFINLSGSFLLGVFMTIAAERIGLDPRWRLFLAVGFLGAYTTFSTYTFDSINLLLQGQWGSGLFNLFGSAAIGGLLVIAGIVAGRWILEILPTVMENLSGG